MNPTTPICGGATVQVTFPAYFSAPDCQAVVNGRWDLAAWASWPPVPAGTARVCVIDVPLGRQVPVVPDWTDVKVERIEEEEVGS